MRHYTKRKIQLASTGLLIAFILYMFRGVLYDAVIIVFGALTVSFLTEPLVHVFERWFRRPLASLCALLSILCVGILGLCCLFPVLAEQFRSLLETLPVSVERTTKWLRTATSRINLYIPEFHIPFPTLHVEQFTAIADRAIGIAGSVMDFFYQFSMMIVLGYFFLCDKERLALRFELLVPFFMRETVVKTGSAICRELKNYLRGQGMIAAMVGALSAAGLWFVGIDSALVLGSIIGVLNMIPYFGPVIGAVPAVLTALGSGPKAALAAVVVLWLVQQVDSTLISPRIMSSVSGVTPAVVLLSVFIGSNLGGIIGMLLAMPAVMAFRTVFRVFVQRHENV